MKLKLLIFKIMSETIVLTGTHILLYKYTTDGSHEDTFLVDIYRIVYSRTKPHDCSKHSLSIRG